MENSSRYLTCTCLDKETKERVFTTVDTQNIGRYVPLYLERE
jgi:hypothetical protein